MASTLGNKQVALSTTAAKVVDASTKPSKVMLKNKDASIVIYVGKTGVTSSTGYALAAGVSVTLEFDESTPEVYAVAASGTPSIMVLRVA